MQADFFADQHEMLSLPLQQAGKGSRNRGARWQADIAMQGEILRRRRVERSGEGEPEFAVAGRRRPRGYRRLGEQPPIHIGFLPVAVAEVGPADGEIDRGDLRGVDIR